jgi:hypothetical protein
MRQCPKWQWKEQIKLDKERDKTWEEGKFKLCEDKKKKTILSHEL